MIEYGFNEVSNSFDTKNEFSQIFVTKKLASWNILIHALVMGNDNLIVVSDRYKF